MRIHYLLILAAQAIHAQDRLASISGRVVNLVGEPVSGITVDDHDVTSQADGSFRVSGLTPGTHHLSVASPGFRTERLEFDLAAREDLVLPLIQVTVSDAGCPAKPHADRKLLQRSPDRGVLAGDVVAGQAPLPAEVTLEGSDERRISVTDAKGRNRFDALKPGLYTITARRLGFYEERETFTVEAGFESTYSGDLRLSLCLDAACKLPRQLVEPRCE